MVHNLVNSGPSRRVQFGLRTSVQRSAFRRGHALALKAAPNIVSAGIYYAGRRAFATYQRDLGTKTSNCLRFPWDRQRPTGSRIVNLSWYT